MRVKEESEKAGLKLNFQKTKIMAFNPTTSWQIDREKVEAVTDFPFLDSKITVDSDCSCKSKRRSLLGRKVMTNLDSILKNRHHFTDKCPYSQNYGFSSSHVWTWELDHKEGWALKNGCLQIVILKTLFFFEAWKIVFIDKSIFFFKFSYFNWRTIAILWWFLPHINMNRP